jgi:hypothetical protein
MERTDRPYGGAIPAVRHDVIDGGATIDRVMGTSSRPTPGHTWARARPLRHHTDAHAIHTPTAPQTSRRPTGAQTIRNTTDAETAWHRMDGRAVRA